MCKFDVQLIGNVYNWFEGFLRLIRAANGPFVDLGTSTMTRRYQLTNTGSRLETDTDQLVISPSRG